MILVTASIFYDSFVATGTVDPSGNSGIMGNNVMPPRLLGIILGVIRVKVLTTLLPWY